MAPSKLEGHEPREYHEYEYDDAGKLIGCTVYREPEYTPGDVELLTAVLAYQQSLGSHGHPLDEATSRLADPSSRESTYGYRVPLPTIDYAQQALTRAKKEYADAYPDADLDALLWRVEKVLKQ